MWTISEIKNKGLFFFKKNYWWTVLVVYITVNVNSLISSIATAPSYLMDFFLQFLQLDLFSYGGRFYESLLTDSSLFLFIGLIYLFLFFSYIILFIFKIFLLSPIEVGQNNFMFRQLYAPAQLNNILAGFKGNYKNVVKVMFFKDLRIILWSLLFCIPGIIKSYEYRLVPYILAEDPNISKDEALGLSSAMMDGHKSQAFLLDLSFLGWDLLSVFATCGILTVFYVAPYKLMTNAALYEKLKMIYNHKVTLK